MLRVVPDKRPVVVGSNEPVLTLRFPRTTRISNCSLESLSVNLTVQDSSRRIKSSSPRSSFIPASFDTGRVEVAADR